ncbi:MAG: hypothetical protein U9N02_08005 [Campylobacterota bacterium]|nr:hypothetical protein [Campylobacterota bacterium]
MSTKNKNPFLNILSVNPNYNYFSNESGFLNELKKPVFKKEQFVISNLNIKNTITSQISISKNIPEEDLYDAITTKAYDELALDQAIEYQINYIETNVRIDEKNRNFYLFIVEPSIVEEVYKTVIEKIKYVDIIIPTPLLIKSLYQKEIIEDNGVHCFIYFQNDDAFIAIYNEYEFIYAKSLKYSFSQMHEKFCELYGERIEFKDFMDFFQKHNLKDTQSDYKEYFIKLYKEIFSNINDILTYIKRAYDLESIDRVYIGSEVSTVTKLNEILEYEIHIKANNFEFDYGFEDNKVYIDQIHSLMHLYTTISDDEKYLCNFTTFHRPPKFTQRQSGKIIILTLISIIIAFAYPVSYWTLSYAQSLQLKLLNKNYENIHNIKSVREVTIKNKELEKRKALKLLNEQKQQYTNKKNTLIKIHDVKVNYPMKAKLLSMLTKDINKYNVKLNFISYSEDADIKQFHLNLISSNDKQITSLIKHLTKKYHDKFDLSIKDIFYEKSNNIYISKLKVIIL